MTINMKAHPRIGSGAAGDVFNVDGVACKVFRVFAVAHPERPIVEATFESEIGAYKRIETDPWLQTHTANYYGTTTVDDVLDENDKSVKDRYALDCCYQIESLAGDETKLLRLLKMNAHLQEAHRRFLQAGIDLNDASVFNGTDPEQFKFIDFKLRLGMRPQSFPA